MDKQAEVLIDNYESERNGEILKQFNSLKPRPFAGVISLILLMAGLYAANSIFDVELMDSGYYWLVFAFIGVSGAIESESRKINKRIDLLAKLLKVT